MRLILAYIMYIYLFFSVWSIKNYITIQMLKLQLISNFIVSMADVHDINSVVYLLEKKVLVILKISIKTDLILIDFNLKYNN